MISIALFQPDIAPNVGAILRLAACLDVDVHIIEPAGFPWSASSLRRAGLDYMEHARIVRHASFAHFQTASAGGRVVLLSTRAATNYASSPLKMAISCCSAGKRQVFRRRFTKPPACVSPFPCATACAR